MNLRTTAGAKLLAFSLFTLSWSTHAQDIGDPSCDRLLLEKQASSLAIVTWYTYKSK